MSVEQTTEKKLRAKNKEHAHNKKMWLCDAFPIVHNSKRSHGGRNMPFTISLATGFYNSLYLRIRVKPIKCTGCRTAEPLTVSPCRNTHMLEHIHDSNTSIFSCCFPIQTERQTPADRYFALFGTDAASLIIHSIFLTRLTWHRWTLITYWLPRLQKYDLMPR